MRKLVVIIAVALSLIVTVQGQVQRLATLEGLPDSVRARLEVKTRAAASAAKSGAFGAQYFMFVTKRWQGGDTISVAFLGGNDALRQQIASTANDWSNGADVHFDFIDPATGKFREWTRTDQTFKAQIRVAFDGVEGGGYWSLIGIDGTDPTLISPGQASLQLQGFTSGLPPDWQGIVRHEFGHALGLMHEHQIPVGGCDQDFKWEDDVGYVPTQDAYGQYVSDSQNHNPGIYTLLAGAPNYWPKQKVDDNMRQLTADSANYDYGPFDNTSIMKYYFDPRFFRNGTLANCYSQENINISNLDEAGIARWYPAPASAASSSLAQKQAEVMNTVSNTTKLKSVQSIQSIK